MRQCPNCKTPYGDEVQFCEKDGYALMGVVVASDKERLLHTTILERYRIMAAVGDGGMGVVYRAKDLRGGPDRAVKVLRAEYSEETDHVLRFRQEAEAVSKIRHPNVIEVNEFGELDDKSQFYVMEFLEGRSLARVLHEQGKRGEGRWPLGEKRAIHIARQICGGLGAAHSIGVVHRDLKPDNIHLVRRGEDRDFVKILDFGIAKVIGAHAARTRTGSVFGTPHYMAPEQARGERDMDARTDIYALGVLLYEMVVGRVPFESENLMGVLTAQVYNSPEPPRHAAGDGIVTEALEAVILKALVKRREGRYATMTAFEEDLARVERGVAPLALNDPEVTAIKIGWQTENLPELPARPSDHPTHPNLPAAGPPSVFVQPDPAPNTIPPVSHPRPATGSNNSVLYVGLGALAVALGGVVALLISTRGAPAANLHPVQATQPVVTTSTPTPANVVANASPEADAGTPTDPSNGASSNVRTTPRNVPDRTGETPSRNRDPRPRNNGSSATEPPTNTTTPPQTPTPPTPQQPSSAGGRELIDPWEQQHSTPPSQ